MDDRDVLSKHVKPTHYNLALRNLDFAKWTYDGIVAIDIELTEPSDTIKLHAFELKLKSAHVSVGGDATNEPASCAGPDENQ